MKSKFLIIFGALSVMLFASCVSAPPTLYNWSTYETASYKYLKNADEASLTELMTVYETIINGQEKTIRQTVPPGICADYGYFLLKAGKINEGKAMLKKEIELYPESKKYIDKIMGAI